MNDYDFRFYRPSPTILKLKAGRGITKDAIGKVALVDLEHNRADLREHLPRPVGSVLEVFEHAGSLHCNVLMGEDPHAQLRAAQKVWKEDLKLREIELNELQKDYEDECAAHDDTSKNFVDAGLKIDELEAELAKTKLELVASEEAGRFFARSAVGLSSQIYATKNALRRAEDISQIRLKACERYENEVIPQLQAEIEVLKALKPKPQKWGIYFAPGTLSPGKLTDCFENTYDTQREAQLAVEDRIANGFADQHTYEVLPIRTI